MSKIETDLVFLDTCIYVTHKFNFKSLLFLGFMDLCKQKHIKPITTNVHQIELENKMNEIVGVAVSAHKKFRNLGLPLRNLNNEALSKHLSRIDTLQLQVGFANLLSEFNNQTGTEII